LNNISEAEFNELFLKNLFKEFIVYAQGRFCVGELDKMVMILTRIFLREFGSGKTPTQIINECEDVEKWLDEKIELFKS